MIHDSELLDRLANFSPITFSGEVYRAVRKNLDPIAPSSAGGRWSPRGECSILYTSLTREGALAEIVYHWRMLDPLPSKPATLATIKSKTTSTLKLIEADITGLGVEPYEYDQINNLRTQEIGAAINFLGCDGLIAPSARWNCENLMLFFDNLHSDTDIELVTTEEVDWQTWSRENS